MGLATALATALAYFPYRLLDGSSERKAAALRAQYEQTVTDTQRLANENQRLRRQIEALKGDVGAIEDIAREELGMVRPNEVIFRIEEVRGEVHEGGE
ncbi:Septum formation initiator [Haliangium ochraceum DSM 14365]|uniref:Septum formation initiator n=2 Tax=Haliangium ochraceum TaxID=80816 RepID=D0LIT0_HALO1|nr:Septum formation initiator [Haliangium ochraceum DSM 14365]